MDADLHPDDVAYAGVTGQLEMMRDGRLTAVELLELCLERIDRLDPQVNAFRTLFRASALAEAQAADAARAAGDERPLLGIPVAVKDNVAIAGHAPAMGTGSPEPVSPADAEQVRLLRAAGAVVVGTTHLPELALWPFTESQTWGVTRNPWSTGFTSGGSSGGSGTAVAAGMVPAATASDGGGSIRIPAAACGLVGLKPQRDRVSLAPHAEHWHGLSVTGILTRTVADTALVLSVLTEGGLSAETPDPAALRVAWTTKAPVPTSVHPAVEGALQGTLQVLRGQGHDVAPGEPVYGKVQASFVLRYLAGARDDLLALADPGRTEPRTRLAGRLGRAVGARLVATAKRWGEFDVVPQDVDVLVMPTTAAPPRAVGSLAGLKALALAGRVAAFTPTANVTGQPAISVPAGHTADGLPLAVQIIGHPGSEQLLLSLAAQLERLTSFSDRRPPI
ncbi:MAG: amiB2 [Frankiales bacterium]|nr:amiB2 [Frankiales bacterium]